MVMVKYWLIGCFWKYLGFVWKLLVEWINYLTESFFLDSLLILLVSWFWVQMNMEVFELEYKGNYGSVLSSDEHGSVWIVCFVVMLYVYASGDDIIEEPF